ncbi:hypothetical protein ENBRE01_0814 [Enteropsectra breve]|nr:hypothetical protein ENBRE01_0814 [Enteropsectra breve]
MRISCGIDAVKCLVLLALPLFISCKKEDPEDLETVKITSLTFDNKKKYQTARLKFSQDVIIKNIFITQTINNERTSDFDNLIYDIEDPADYYMLLVQAELSSGPSTAAYKNALTRQIEIDLTNSILKENELYSFHIQFLDTYEEVYSDSFMYNDGKIKTANDKKKVHWYANPWVWATIATIVIAVLLVAFLIAS